MTNESTLDELFAMTARRTREINEKGVPFIIGLGETERKGLITEDGKIFFTPDTAAYPGQIVRSTQGAEYFIKSAVSKAGRVEATVIPVTMHLTVYQHHNKGQHPVTKQSLFAFSLAKTNVPAAFDRDQGALVVSASSAPRPADLIKSGSSTWQVTAVIFNSGVAFVNVEEYIDPQNKTAPVRHEKIFEIGRSTQPGFTITVN